jgi:hypothetical protein
VCSGALPSVAVVRKSKMFVITRERRSLERPPQRWRERASYQRNRRPTQPLGWCVLARQSIRRALAVGGCPRERLQAASYRRPPTTSKRARAEEHSASEHRRRLGRSEADAA